MTADGEVTADGFLRGRAAIVVGGSGGIGKAIAQALGAAGAAVAIGSRSASAACTEDLKANGVRCAAYSVDVRSTESLSSFYRSVESAFGKVDILVNSAGSCHHQKLCGHPDETWNEVIDVNLNGVFRATKLCLPGMIARRWGRIINIASDIALLGVPEYVAYCASKAAVVSFTRCVALEGAPYGVCCNTISPGWVDTALARRAIAQAAASEGSSAAEYIEQLQQKNPQKRMIAPEEIAELAVYLCRNEAQAITMQDITVSGGARW